MKNKDRKRKVNFGIKKISIYQYLNYYFNPNCDVSLAMFYKDYFSDCTHEQFLEKIEKLKQEISFGDFEEVNSEEVLNRLRQYHMEESMLYETNYRKCILKNYLPEMKYLCNGVVPINYFKSVKQCDVLSGRVLCVKDSANQVKYYSYDPYFLEDTQTLYEKEQKKLTKRIDKEKIKY